jgi:predicted phage tail protein
MSADQYSHLTTVTLHGFLGKKFGRTWKLAISDIGELFQAIEAQRPGFKSAVASCGARWRVLNDGVPLEEQSVREGALALPAGRQIRIVPCPQGASKGLFGLILGVILVVVGSIFTFGLVGVAAVAAGTFAATAASAAIGIGLSLVLSGLASLFTSSVKNSKSTQNLPSYLFDGPANVNEQGGPVPVLYGRQVVGSVTIYASLTPREYTAAMTGSGGSSSGGSGGGHGVPVIVLAS